ncbi:hypothetical protein CDD83_5425 [Cordyceps sp. RAO-2017]|nr:hypothetical protein CDD83_5425 [Cordyceps sp. RAO-2017]
MASPNATTLAHLVFLPPVCAVAYVPPALPPARQTIIMPLVVPGVTTAAADPLEEWRNKLVGKTLLAPESAETTSSETMFREHDLPRPYRVVWPGRLLTRDMDEGRLNVVVDEDRSVTNVWYG